jgi:hypothetical protein
MMNHIFISNISLSFWYKIKNIKIFLNKISFNLILYFQKLFIINETIMIIKY